MNLGNIIHMTILNMDMDTVTEDHRGTMIKKVEVLIKYNSGIWTLAFRDQHKFSTIPRLKGSSVGRAHVWKMASKAHKAVTIVSYRKTNTFIRTGKVSVFQ